jgi:hypothetical protein
MAAGRRLVATSAGGWLAAALVWLGIATAAVTARAVSAVTAGEEKDSDEYSGDEDDGRHHLHPPGSPGGTCRFSLRAGVVSELVLV